MSIDKGAITGHFIAHWGVPSEIRPRQVNPFGELAILEFAPKGKRSSWRYATNGMSSKAQAANERGGVRVELYTTSLRRAPWIDELLLAVATYPFLNNTYLSEFDTIDVQGPIDQGVSPYTGIMLAPPGPFDSETLGLAGKPGEDVLIHQVVGLLPNELERAVRGGAKDVLKALLIQGEAAIDRVRS